MQINIDSSDGVQMVNGVAYLSNVGLCIDGDGTVTRMNGQPASAADLDAARNGLRTGSEGMIAGAAGMESGARAMEGTVAAGGAAGMYEGAQSMRVSAAQLARLADLAHL